MAQSSMLLFFQGRLFRDTGKAMRQLVIGIFVATAIFVIAVKFGAPLWLAGLVAGLVGGMLQPFLFKDLRYN